VHESVKDQFVEEAKKTIETFFGSQPSQSKDYTHIVNKGHTARLKNMIADAVAKGATVTAGGTSDEAANYIAPTILENCSPDSLVMTEEIFGPIMPIVTYKNQSEVVNHINAGEKPLALYIFSKSSKNIAYFLDNTRAGGTCINNNALHFFNNDLPFGGSNNSGLGKSHGHFGFLEFSNARAIYKQHIPGALELLMPPYSNLKSKLIELTVKYF